MSPSSSPNSSSPSPVPDPRLLLRRGSLPANVLLAADAPALTDRRRSVDAALHHRANPYPTLSRTRNGLLLQASSRRALGRRPPMPDVPSITRHASIDTFAFRHPQHPVVRNSLPDNALYALSSRTVAAPIPGPLPSAGYSFGAATTSTAGPPSTGSESPSPNPFDPFSLPRDDAGEDDSTSSYNPYSRFGSLASIDTASSATSAYYSEYGSDFGGQNSPACPRYDPPLRQCFFLFSDWFDKQ